MNVFCKRVPFFLALCFLLCFGVCAAGSGDGPDSQVEGPAVEAPPFVVVQDFSVDGLASALSEVLAGFREDGELVDVLAVSVPLEEVDSGIAPIYDLDDGQTSEPSGTLKSILVKLIGPYNPVVVQYRYQNSNQSSYSYVREIQPDYVWCASAALFALLVFCTFRLGGALLRKI